MKVFISWSDETSHAIAQTLGEWIPSVIQAVETYVPPEEIRNGTEWVDAVSKELNRSSLALLCVVPENIDAPWLNFEAGAFLKFLEMSKVIPLLFYVERADLNNGPLAQFPSAIYEKDDMYQIMETINKNTEKGKLSEERLRTTFDVWWPKLQLDVDSVRETEATEIPDPDLPEKVPDPVEPKEAPDTEEPEEATVTGKADEPAGTGKTAETSKTGKAEAAPGAGKEDEAPLAEKAEEEEPDAGKTEEKPERSVKTAKKSEPQKAEDADKPKKPVSSKPALDEMDIELLKVLYRPPGYTPMTAAAVGHKLNVPAQKAREHLDILERRNYVREYLYLGRPKEYSIAPKGREYLTKHDLAGKRQDK